MVEARGRVTEGTTPLECQVLVCLFFQCGLVRGAFHRAHFGANAHGAEIVHQGLDHAGIDAVDAALPGVEAVGIPRLFQELAGFLLVVRVRL